MGTVHGLQVPHGIPVMFHKHHSVCTRQVQSKTTYMGGQQQYVNGRVIVKPEEKKNRIESLISAGDHIHNIRPYQAGSKTDQCSDLETME